MSARSETLEVEGKEKETVPGSDSPENVESRTFTFDAILRSLCWDLDRGQWSRSDGPERGDQR